MLKASFTGSKIEAGCDEAGRGCLAGPVVAAAVILPLDYHHPKLNDSKQLKAKDREMLRFEIEKEAIAWAVAEVGNQEIDKINILNASFLAMHRALDSLKMPPDLILVDGNRFKNYQSIPHECIVKGDGIYFSIAAASVLAKTYRDELMCKIGEEYRAYAWHQNMGYPTVQHRNAIRQFGLSPYHRLSFRQLPEQLELFAR